MKRNTNGKTPNTKKKTVPDKKEKPNPVAMKKPAKSGGSIHRVEEADVAEFSHREKVSKVKKKDIISDSGVRDDDDDGVETGGDEKDEEDSSVKWHESYTHSPHIKWKNYDVEDAEVIEVINGYYPPGQDFIEVHYC